MHILGRNECIRNKIELRTYGLYQRVNNSNNINNNNNNNNSDNNNFNYNNNSQKRM